MLSSKMDPNPKPASERRRDSLFLKACRGEPTDRTPIWLMRQAGRYMKEYREVRKNTSFLDLCKDKNLCAEVAVTAAERIDADAAILFSDILLIVEPLGLKLEYGKAESPLITASAEITEMIDRLPEIRPEDSLGFVFDAVRETRRQLNPELPLIGFSGAPFTLASYILEGGGSKNFIKTKSLMYSNPQAWHNLMAKLSRGISKYLLEQIHSGVDAVQLFDSWVGCLSPRDYELFVLPHTKAIFDAIGTSVPTIHFGTNTATLLPLIQEAGGDVIGADFRISIMDAWNKLGDEARVQGNLDPVTLLSSLDETLKSAERILDDVNGRSGHIFNLGHGILPKTPVENVIELIKHVKAYSKR